MLGRHECGAFEFHIERMPPGRTSQNIIFVYKIPVFALQEGLVYDGFPMLSHQLDLINHLPTPWQHFL